MIVTVTPTVMDGTVVRWRPSEGEPAMVSASRNGVYLECWLNELEQGVFDTAVMVWKTLQRNSNADFSHLATHQRIGRSLVPVNLGAVVAGERVRHPQLGLASGYIKGVCGHPVARVAWQSGYDACAPCVTAAIK